MLRVRLFGGLALAWDDDPLPTIPGTVARSLFAYLVTYRDRPHTRDLLAGTFWPDLPDTTARRRLSKALWQIRRAFRPAPGTPSRDEQDRAGSPPKVLLTAGDTVQLHPDLSLWLDVEEFEQQVAASRQERFGLAADGLLRAAELYRGEFLAGYYDDWAVVERERLQGMLLEALGRLAAGYKGRGEYEPALGFARRLAAEEPWREEAHREVMRLCHLLGRDAEALKQFEVCRQALAEELGVDPAPETLALADEIAMRSGLSRPPLLPSAARPVAVPLLERPDRLPLVGRGAELAELLRRVEAAVEGTGGLTLVYGEAGVGKSRLLRELAENAQWRSMRAVWGRCYELATPPAYQPLVEALRADLPALDGSALESLWRAELSRLLPELATGEAPPPLAPEEQQRRLLEAIARGFLALADTAPTLVLLEDAQWMDAASLDALRYLLPRLGEVPLLVVVTARSEELEGRPAEVMAAMESTRLAGRLELDRLSQVATGELVQRALELEGPAALFSARLYAETEGNPFFLVETLWTLVEEGLLYRDEAGAWSTRWDESTEDYGELPLPPGVVQSIERRLDRLPGRLDDLLDLAAVIGREVGFPLWLAASGRDEGMLLAAGDALCARGLLLAGEPTPSGRADYVFAHDQIRWVAHRRLAPPRRRLYHRRVAEALTALAPGEPAALAYHWTQAEEWDEAADCHQQAGVRAWAVYATASALDHYTQALEALERLPGPVDLARRVQLLLARERVLDRLGQRKVQAEDLQELETLAHALNDDLQQARVALRRSHHAGVTGNFPLVVTAAQQAIRLARAAQDVGIQAEGYLNWGRALCEQADYEAARTRLETSLDLARAAGVQAMEADVLRVLSAVSERTGDYESALTFGEQALHIYRHLGDRLGEGRMLNNLGIVSDYQGDYTRAMAYYEQALNIFRLTGHRLGEGMALANLGTLAHYQGAYAQARAYSEQALPIYRAVGYRNGEAHLLTSLGNVSLEQGEFEGAETYLEQALQIYREIGERHGEGYPLHSLGNAARQRGDYAAARRFLETSLRIRREIGDRLGEGSTLQTLGAVSRCLGDYSQARVYLERSLHIFREIGARQNEGACLSELSLLFHLLQDDQTAQTFSQRALAVAHSVGDRPTQGCALTNLGHALMGLGRVAEAAEAYQEALNLHRALGRHHLAVESQAGLARLYLAQRDLPRAREQVGEILAYLDARINSTGTGYSLDGTEEPFRVYLTCYQILRASGDFRAEGVLTAAHDLLQEQAIKIDDEALKGSFLENVAANREIVAAYQDLRASQKASLVTVSLPRADAPLGRPLREDEFMAVAWTVAAPEDEAISGKVARRRQRILRLLREAEAQGAAPRDEDLAGVLDVSLSTLRRDMAALRAEGHALPTRWRKMTT